MREYGFLLTRMFPYKDKIVEDISFYIFLVYELFWPRKNSIFLSFKFLAMYNLSSQKTLTGSKLWMQQLMAILIKRFHHAKRSKKGFISQILLPAIFVIVAMFASLIRPTHQNMPSLKLSVHMFKKPNAILFENHNINEFSEKLSRAYMEAANSLYFNDTTPKSYWKNEMSRKCDCSSGNYNCPANSYSSVATHRTPNGDTIYDITGGDMNDYLLKTTAQFRRKR